LYTRVQRAKNKSIMAIIDVITFNNEHELWDLRYNILKDHVDEFIVVEFDKTFSGRPKNRTFTYNLPEKVSYYFITEDQYSKYMDLALSSPNTKGAEHWKREFCQKESIKDCLTHLKDKDMVFIGDCDEIWNDNALMFKGTKPIKLKLKVYTYYLNNKSSEEFWGTLATEYEEIKDKCLNHIRSQDWNDFGWNEAHWKSPGEYGWHFTSMHHQLEKKLKDSYTEESYATPEVMANLEENIKQNKDFLGRSFTYTVDETEWPDYLKEHRQDYKHLLK